MTIGVYLINQTSGKKHPLLNASKNVIGRGIESGENPSATILLPHPAVSYEHATIYIDPETQIWKLESTGSNGTIVNGNTVENIDLKHGDDIQVGPYTLTFYEKFGRQATMEIKMPKNLRKKNASKASEWEDEELTPLGSLMENIAIFVLLALIGFILFCVFG